MNCGYSRREATRRLRGIITRLRRIAAARGRPARVDKSAARLVTTFVNKPEKHGRMQGMKWNKIDSRTYEAKTGCGLFVVQKRRMFTIQGNGPLRWLARRAGAAGIGENAWPQQFKTKTAAQRFVARETKDC